MEEAAMYAVGGVAMGAAIAALAWAVAKRAYSGDGPDRTSDRHTS